MSAPTTLATVRALATNLSSRDKARLLVWLGAEIEREIDDSTPTPKGSLLGLLKDLGPAPSEVEIDEARHEAWSSFPREDV